MRRRYLFALALASCANLIASCVGEDPDVSTAPVSDAGTESATPQSEGGNDAPPYDGFVDAGGTFCEQKGTSVLFCADFDTVASVGVGWDSVRVGSGSAQLDGLFTTSAPAAALLRLNANP